MELISQSAIARSYASKLIHKKSPKSNFETLHAEKKSHNEAVLNIYKHLSMYNNTIKFGRLYIEYTT